MTCELDFDLVMKREYKKWKAKYYSAKAQDDYEKMERCHAQMMRCLNIARKDFNQAQQGPEGR